ncbi:autotransporter outer membrane beta-barrel domain-containing protein [Parendozoicomonas haliclonae]|uniref:autotransporter outer membrane beta-barrel domain-containing protein n=1 Tax=Parendozoicomonas haliclonae TaxID=1960125 RepID=UPI0039F057C4
MPAAIVSVLLSGTYSQLTLAEEQDPAPFHESLFDEAGSFAGPPEGIPEGGIPPEGFPEGSIPPGDIQGSNDQGMDGDLGVSSPDDPVYFEGGFPKPYVEIDGISESDVIAGNAPLFTAPGNITFNEAVEIQIDGGIENFIDASAGKEFILLKAEGTLNYTEGYLKVLTDSPLFDITVVAEDNALKIRVEAKDVGDVIEQSGASLDAQEVISTFQQDVITELDESDPLYALFEAASNSSEELADLAEDLKPEDSNSTTAAATATQSATFGSIATRTSSVRSGGTGISSGDMFQSGGFWAQVLHSKGNQETRNASKGFTSHLTGVTVGLDTELNTDWVAGAALTTAKSKTNTKDSNNTTTASSFIGSFYASWQFKDWFADVMASAGRTKNKAKRFNQLIKSDFDAHQYGLRLTVGQDIPLKNLDIQLQPTVSFNYGRVDIGKYQEEGTAGAQEIQAQRYETVELGAGIAAMKSFSFNKNTLNVSVNLMGWHDFAADQAKTQSRFLTGETILTTFGDKPERTTWQAGLGLDYLAGDNLTFSLNYDHTWKKSFKADSVSAKVRYDF